MRTSKLVLALLASVAIAPTAFAQMNKHDRSIATYNYNIQIQEIDSEGSDLPLNAQLDRGMISEDGAQAAAPAMPAPMQGQQGQAPMMTYQDAASMSGAQQPMPYPVYGAPSPSGPAPESMTTAGQAVQIGTAAPAFTLPDTMGGAFSLKDMVAKGPVMILFTRGASCSLCTKQMSLLQKNQKQFAALGIRTVAVAPESAQNLASAKQRLGITYPLLSDANAQVARTYGLTDNTRSYSALVTVNAQGQIADVQIEQGITAFNLTRAADQLNGIAVPVAPPSLTQDPAPQTQAVPPSVQPNAMPQALPVPSAQMGKVSFDVPPSSPDFGKKTNTAGIAI